MLVLTHSPSLFSPKSPPATSPHFDLPNFPAQKLLESASYQNRLKNILLSAEPVHKSSSKPARVPPVLSVEYSEHALRHREFCAAVRWGADDLH